MNRIIKNTILQYIPSEIAEEKEINPARIFAYNNNEIKNKTAVYVTEREIRAKDNFALQFAIKKSKEMQMQLRIIHPQNNYNKVFSDIKNKFIQNRLEEAKLDFEKTGLKLEIFKDDWPKLLQYLKKIDTGLLIIDFDPIVDRSFLKKAPFKVLEIDGHNIIPSRFVSDKQEYNAATLRRKIYFNISEFLTDFAETSNIKNEADTVLEQFLSEKLPFYAQLKNDPSKNMTSNLSAYINYGFISSQRIALKVLNAECDDINKEVFLEELIVRKELADNFCLYCRNYKTFECTPQWAQQTLKAHQHDLRSHLYTLENLEQAKTYDSLWNATQIQLMEKGKIHGYLRMYWAKKILQWSATPDEALKTAIYLNDKYGFDAPSANGYTGILWAIGGLHDRAFQDRMVTGKIRIMTDKSIKTKYDIQNYINSFASTTNDF